MSSRFSSRVTAALISGLLVAGSITATAPAFADDIVEPAPVSTETAAPDAPVEGVTEEPVVEATEEPTAPDATPEVLEPGATTVSYSGYIAPLADRDTEALADDFVLFRVVGLGYLRVNLDEIDATSPDGKLTLKIAVPEGLTIGDDAFTVLADYSRTVEPLKAIEAIAPRSVNKLIGQAYVAPAVHKVFAVLVTPSNVAGVAPNAQQTSVKVQAAVDHASDYWSGQSDGKITFELAGVVPWYKSAYNCNVATDANADNLWAEGAAKAATGPNQIGYEDAQNNHLVLIFPSGITTECGGALGLGTGASSVNAGGLVWTVGTDAAQEKSTLAHELGHNMGFGHANWLDCSTSNPTISLFGLSGCTQKEYGDVFDVMGFAVSGKSGGSSSSPNAIRTGLWSTSAYTNVPKGTTTYTLQAMGTNSGKRALVIEDTSGVNYFVEYRSFVGDDAQYSGGYGACNTAASACVSSTPGVRLLKLEQQVLSNGGSYKGFSMDATHLIGRTVSGVKRVDYKASESFTTSSGLNITVNSISGDTASVTVTRPANGVSSGYVDIFPSLSYDDDMRVGDVWTAYLASDWEADSYSYQWYRNGSKISGGTKASYVLSSADKGKYIAVTVTGKSGSTSRSGFDGYYGPITSGVLNTGTVSIDSSAATFVSKPAGWATPGTSFSYQWLRNGAAISGATKSTYTPTSSDTGKSLSVKLSASKSGYGSVAAVYSAEKDYTVSGAGAVSVTGTVQVGKTLGIADTMSYSTTVGAVASPIRTYQWYADGVSIPGATASTYTLTSTDYSKAISVKVTARAAGYASHNITTAKTGDVIKGEIAGALTAPVVTKAPGTLALTVALPGGSVTEASVKYSYQWYRGTTAISGATKSTYTLTSSDKGADVKVRVIVSKSNYSSVTLYSAAKNYSLTTGSSTAIAGTAVVGSALGAPSLVFTTSDGAATPTVTRQWYRDGVAISGKTAESYTLTSSDYGKYITVKTTAVLPGYISYSATSPKSAKVGKGVLSGTKLAPVITQSGMTLTGALPVGSYTDTVSLSYQWYRSGAAISKATKSTYTLTSSDYNKEINLRVTIAKSYYTTETKYSLSKNYSVIATPAVPLIAGTIAQGNTIEVDVRDYVANGVVVTGDATLSYQWYRSGVAIPGATASSYLLDAADLGKTITVKVTAAYAGYMSSVATSAATQKIGASALAGHSDLVFFANTIDPATNTLTAGSTGITEPGVTLAYQWYRGTAAISMATKSTYKLTSSDFNKEISVRVTTSKSGFTSVVKYSFKENYSVVPSGKPILSDTTPIKGQLLSVTLPSYTADGVAYVPDPEFISYQWYRSGAAISGTAAKQATYTAVTADKGKTLSVKVTVSKSGFLSAATTSSATSTVK